VNAIERLDGWRAHALAHRAQEVAVVHRQAPEARHRHAVHLAEGVGVLKHVGNHWVQLHVRTLLCVGLSCQVDNSQQGGKQQ